ncbi:uncharacterized protein LOC114535956 [Dendronephthya gigantea]|uniref:uncharacterized protein LOC114535956 n=1 Tax=Dendronephthya gigantea TaxID=151771 RepID=UPI00106B8A7E|nr:uncharacterized protein LOC114535956 [Dendronephthya gigantea]
MYVTRYAPIQNDLNDRWKHGPEFLSSPEELPQKTAVPEEELVEVNTERCKAEIVCKLTLSKAEEETNIKKFSSWRRLIRVTARMKRLGREAQEKGGETNDVQSLNMASLLATQELHEAEVFWIREAQKCVNNHLAKGEFKSLSPFQDEDDVIRVGGRVYEAIVTFECKHPALLPHNHWISYLITCKAHKFGHNRVATTTVKTQGKYWILRVHDLAKSIKYCCVFCREMKHKVESQIMADLPQLRLVPCTPPFHTACDHFGPLIVKISHNKTAKHYGVVFTCLNTRAANLELALDCSTMEFLQFLSRFMSIRGQPTVMSDNGTQFVGVIIPKAPHQNESAEAMGKTCKRALKKVIGDQTLTPFELYTYLLECANFVNQRPICRVLNNPDGSYLCPYDVLLGASNL